MEFIIAVAVVVILILINENFRSGKSKDKLLKRIREAWGVRPVNEFDSRDFEGFSTYYNACAKKRTRFAIDDITWNDLEMDRLYSALNRTHTTMGDELLYSVMRTPVYDEAEFEKRKRLIDFWINNKDDREKVQVELEKFGKYNGRGPSVLLGNSDYLELDDDRLFRMLTFIPVIAIPLIFFNVGLGLLILALSLGGNLFYHERLVKELDSKLPAVSSAVSMVALAGRLFDKLKGVPDQADNLRNLYDRLKKVVKKGSPTFFIDRSANTSGDMTAIPKMIFMTDIWSYYSSIRFLRDRKDELAGMIEAVGLLDATISIASYRKSITSWCIPQIAWSSQPENGPVIAANNVKHPLIRNCTGNPINVEKPILLTGSNASGKSTYLKAVALNTLLAHTIMTCLADSWNSVPLFPITSIALRDNVLNGESYFVAEIKSLKRIFQSVNDDVKCLCIIDEVLRGTNTIERIAASSRLLSALALRNACVFAATHDVELTVVLKDKYVNMHFEEKITDHDISFDYRLKEGPATSRNAIKLLELMGFEAALTEDCENAVNDFEKNKRWDAMM